MIHISGTPTPYKITGNFSCDPPDPTAPIFSGGISFSTDQKLIEMLLGVTAELTNVGWMGPLSWNFGVTTPWGNYSTSGTGSWITSCGIEIDIADVTLSVTPVTCAWSLSFSSLTVTVTGIPGPSVVLSIGPQTMGATGGYDERQNATVLYPLLNVGSIIILGCGPTSPVTQSNFLTINGGYSYNGGTTDVVVVDSTLPFGTCPAVLPYPTLTGTSSDNVTATCTAIGSITQAPAGTIVCTGPGGPVTYTIWVQNSSIATGQFFTSVTGGVGGGVWIKDSTVLVAQQTVTNIIDCNCASNVSSTTTTTPTFTTCASARKMVNDTTSITYCYLPRGSLTPPCFPHSTVVDCTANEQCTLFWPTTPPCGPPMTGLAILDYDTSLEYRHGRLSSNPATSTLWGGYSPNGNPYAWVDRDTGIAANSAVIRWQDNNNNPFGIFYESAPGVLSFIQSRNESVTFGAPMTITSSLASGGFFDFEQTSDFNRAFYWLQGSSAPYTIYMTILDNQLNVIKGPLATNITNADLSTLKVREYPQTGGQRHIGILYSVSGVLTFLTARDFVTFS